MKRRFQYVLCALLLFVLSAVNVQASGVIPAERQLPRLVDNAGLLDSDEKEELLEMLNEVSERQKFDVVIVTVKSLGGKTPRAYADDFYDYNGYGMGVGDDGALLLLAMDSRDWYISTFGYGVTAITEAGREYMAEQFVSDFSDGYYFYGFETWVELCDDYVTQARTGEPYDVGHLPGDGFSIIYVFFSLVGGLVVALIATLSMRGQLKSVRPQGAAAGYIKQGSLNVIDRSDIFLYRKVDRRVKPQNTSSSGGGSRTHTSSSGRSHGGGGGKF